MRRPLPGGAEKRSVLPVRARAADRKMRPPQRRGFPGMRASGSGATAFRGAAPRFLWRRAGCAFGDPEDERAELAAAFRVAELCLRHIPATGSLCVFIGQDGCFWNRKDGGSERAGDTVASLLNELEEHGGAAEEAVPSYQWMRV